MLKKISSTGIIIFLVLFAFNFFPALAEPLNYDLDLVSLNINKEKPELKEEVIITAVVRNTGTLTVTSPFTLRDLKCDFPDFTVNDKTNTVSENGLAPGAQVIYTFTGYFTGVKEKTLSCTADGSGLLEENDELDNVKTVKATVMGHDLSVEDIILLPEKPAFNQECFIKVKIKNNGNKNIFDSTGIINYEYSFPDFAKESLIYPTPTLAKAIAPDEYFYYEFKGKFIKVGEKNISFKIDKDDNLIEASEINNLKEEKITVVGEEKKDIMAGPIDLSIENPLVYEDVDIKVKVKNTGDFGFSSDRGFTETDLLYTFPGFEIGAKSVILPATSTPLEPTKEIEFIYRGKFTNAGAIPLSFKVDNKNQIFETDENNNSTSTIANIYLNAAQRDDLNLTDSAAEVIDSTKIKFKFKTSLTATGKVFYHQAEHLSDTQVTGASNANTHEITVSAFQPGKKYLYKAVAQKNERVKETAYFEIIMPVNDNLIAEGLGANISSGNAVISWKTNLISSGVAYYKKTASSTYEKSAEDTGKDNHEITLGNLTPGAYSYYVISTSTPGTVYKSSLKTFTVLASGAGSADNSPSGSQSASGASSGSSSSDGQTKAIAIKNNKLYDSLKGKIVLKVEARGEAYYVDPKTKNMYYMARGEDAYRIMREKGKGITNADLERVPIGLADGSGVDTDGDGLSDSLETAIGTALDKKDSDGDGYGDKAEILSGYSPKEKNKAMPNDKKFSTEQKGSIFLQVQGKGEAWYVNPADGKRYFLGRPEDAYNIMRKLGLGISNSNFSSL